MNKVKQSWRTQTRAPLTSRMVLSRCGVVLVDKDEKQDNRLSCFSTRDGAQAWQTSLDGLGLQVDGVMSIGADAETVYVAQEFSVAAYAADTGAKRWATDVKNPTFNVEDFTGAPPPVITGDQILLSSRHARVVSLDRRTGALLWRSEDMTRAASVLVRGDVVIALANEENDARAYDLASGKERWRHAFSGPFQISERLWSSLALSEPVANILHVMDANKALVALESTTGKVLWAEPIVGLASFTVANSTLLVADSASVRALDPHKGGARWRKPTGGHTLLAPLDGTSALLHLPRATALVDVASGRITEQARNTLIEQDRVLAARDGMAVISVSGGAKLFALSGDRLIEAKLAEPLPRPGEPSQHGVLHAVLAADHAYTFSTSREITAFSVSR